MGTYQVQTNVQTMQTSIWTIGSTSKGWGAGGGREHLQKCDYPIQERMINCKITNPPYPLDVDLATQIEVCIVCMERVVRTWYIPLFNISKC